MIAEKRNVLLILDNATIHEQHWIYSNTKLIFLSLNTTSHCHQLNNADFIANYKEHHRKHHYKRVAHKCLPSTRRDNVDDNNQPVAAENTVKGYLRRTALMQEEDGEDKQLTNKINDILLNQHFKNDDMNSEVKIYNDENMEEENEEIHDNTVDDEKANKDTTLVKKDKHAKEDEEEKYHV
ncbi:hypothetical protein INT46_003259, partial [Mucor plumbeus]